MGRRLGVGQLLLSALGLAAAAPAARPLELGALLAEAQAANPLILAARARLRAAERVPAQAAALPDPSAGVSYTNDTLTDLTLGDSIMSNVTVSWTQEMPYPGKRRLAGDVARQETEVRSSDLEGTRLAVVAAVKKTYAELYWLDRARAIVEDGRGLLESYYATARRRYESGEGILENILKAQTELTRLDVDLAGIAQERRSAGARLSSLLGLPTEAPFGPAVDPAVPAPIQGAALEQAALERSPQIRAFRAASRREEVRIELAERNLKPDFTWSAAYVHRGEIDPMAMGMFGVRLPAWRKHKQLEAVAQARHEAEAATHDLATAELQLVSEVRDLVARVERSRLQMRLYGEGVLPQARSALEAAAASYAVGQAEFVTLIADFRTVLESEREYELRRVEEATALAALEPLTGLTLLRPAEALGQAGLEAHDE